MKRRNRNLVLMDIAQMMSQRSTCSRLNVGAIIARDGRVLSSGYNGAPAGMDHCSHVCLCNGSSIPPRVVPIDGHLDDCPASLPCTIAVHAEANAIVWAARCGVVTDGAALYTTHMPCLPCAQLIINAGIVSVMYAADYRISDGVDLLIKAKVGAVRI